MSHPYSDLLPDRDVLLAQCANNGIVAVCTMDTLKARRSATTRVKYLRAGPVFLFIHDSYFHSEHRPWEPWIHGSISAMHELLLGRKVVSEDFDVPFSNQLPHYPTNQDLAEVLQMIGSPLQAFVLFGHPDRLPQPRFISAPDYPVDQEHSTAVM